MWLKSQNRILHLKKNYVPGEKENIGAIPTCSSSFDVGVRDASLLALPVVLPGIFCTW